jgi:tripartite-type tricarboxylate transporter receptor subunit TctC
VDACLRGCAPLFFTALVVLTAAVPPVRAQEHYPNRPIRIVLPVAPGGGTDALVRMIGQGLFERWGRQVVVENRTGAGTLIASELVVKAKPDGYTLLMTTSTHSINPSVYKKMPYDTVRDFVPITLAESLPSLIVVHPSVAQTLKEFIALAKARPGEIVFASAGRGSNSHLAMELFASMAQIRMIHAPYKSGPPALMAVVAGHVSLVAIGISSSLPQVRAGKLRALGSTGARRAAAAPDIPTIAEAGLPGYESMQWYGMLAPAGTPPEIIAMLHKEIVAILRAPDISERFASEGGEVIASSPEEFAAFIQTEIAKWAGVVRTAGIELE